MSHVLTSTTIAAAVGSGLIAGVFLAFSSFIMPALARTTSPHGAEAMQHINVTVFTGWMMGPFLGTGVLCLLLAAGSIWQTGLSDWLLLTGVALYLLGTIGVTAAFNVPLNETLAPMNLHDPATADYWQHYLSRWTLWNTVRTVASTLACLAFILSLLT